MNGVMSAAAVKRMRTRPWPTRRPDVSLLRPHEATSRDRRRIPIEGRRKTAEWHALQEFLAACDRLRQERLKRSLAGASIATTPRYITIVISRTYDDPTPTTITGSLRDGPTGNSIGTWF